MYEVSALPVILAGLANMISGFVWYNPKVFGDSWMHMVGLTKEKADASAKMMPVMSLIALFFAIVMAYVMAHFAIAWGVWDWIGSVELAFWLWLGFIVPPLLGAVLWEGKSWKLFAINAGYWFVGLCASSLVLISFS